MEHLTKDFIKNKHPELIKAFDNYKKIDECRLSYIQDVFPDYNSQILEIEKLKRDDKKASELLTKQLEDKLYKDPVVMAYTNELDKYKKELINYIKDKFNEAKVAEIISILN